MTASSGALPLMLLCAALAPARAAQDFPELMNVMYDICGTAKFDLTPASPCQFQLFGFAVAWQECGDAHGADMEGFRSCIDSCISPTICDSVCGGSARNASLQQCHGECGKVRSCVGQALARATGQVSAEGFVRDCFTGRDQAAQASLTQQTATLAAGAQLVAVSMALRSQVTPGAIAADGACACSKTSTVRGVNTNRAGCRRHGEEHFAAAEWYCYITGGLECPGAMPSDEFPGLFWLGCAGPFDYYPQLFPATCQVREFGFGPQDQPMAVPPEPEGRGELQLTPAEPPKPRFEEEVKASVQRTMDAAVPLSEAWHAARGDVFLKARDTPPEPGPALPPALDTPVWWRLAQEESEASPVKSKAPRAEAPVRRHFFPNGGFWPEVA